jgi:hypothetical protein
MKRSIMFFAILVSFLIHAIFFSKINFSFNSFKENQLTTVELTQFPEKKLSLNIKKKKVKVEELKEILIRPKKNNQEEAPEGIKKDHYLTENLCELCSPIEEIQTPEEIQAPEETKCYGETIESLLLEYKVSYDLGPNKGSLRALDPFGRSSEKVYKQRFDEVGKLVITYGVVDDKYNIQYKASATGLTSIIYSNPLIQTSRGNISEEGLKPNYYLYQHGPERINEAFFDWVDKTLHCREKEELEQSYSLIDGSQDQLSFMFQFMFLDPLDRMQIPITNGRRLKVYDYHYVDEEILYTREGELKAIHIAKFNYEDQERIDLWLSEKYGYLPIKISITQDDLSVIVQEIITLKAIKNE